MLQLERRGPLVNVRAACRIPFPQGCPRAGQGFRREQFIARTVRDALKKNHFKGRHIVSALKDEQLRFGSVRLRDWENQDQTHLFARCRAELGFAPGQGHVQYLPAGAVRLGAEIGKQYTVFGATDTALIRHRAILDDLGFHHVTLEPLPCALYQSWAHQSTQPPVDTPDAAQPSAAAAPVLLVHIGCDQTTILMADPDVLYWARQVHWGGADLTRRAADHLKLTMPDAEFLLRRQFAEHHQDAPDHIPHVLAGLVRDKITELAQEIDWCAAYYRETFRGPAPRSIILSGAHTYSALLHALLGNTVKMDVRLETAFDNIDIDNTATDLPHDRSALCEWVIALGLSLKSFAPVRETART